MALLIGVVIVERQVFNFDREGQKQIHRAILFIFLGARSYRLYQARGLTDPRTQAGCVEKVVHSSGPIG